MLIGLSVKNQGKWRWHILGFFIYDLIFYFIIVKRSRETAKNRDEKIGKQGKCCT